MKYVGSFFSKTAAYGVALLVASWAISAQAEVTQAEAKVTAIRGSAQYSEGGGSWAVLEVGKILKGGAVIKTAADASVDLYLKKNGPVVRVTSDTTLALDKLVYEETGSETVIETKLNLTNGRILGTVKKLAKASKYEVQIPSGVVAIRGTKYDISANGKINIPQGSVVIGFQGANYTVNAGESFAPPTAPGGTPTITKIPAAVLTDLNRQFGEIPTPTDDGGGLPPVTPPTQPTQEPFVSPVTGGEGSTQP